MIQEDIYKKKLLIIANCPDFEFLGSGYAIHFFTKELRKYYEVDYYDVRNYGVLQIFKNRASIYRQSLGKFLFLLKLFIKGERYNIIEFWGGDSALAIILAKWVSPKTLLVHHTNGLESKYMPMLKKVDHQDQWFHFNLTWLYDLTCTKVDGVITTTKFDALWAKNKFKNTNVETVPLALLEEYLHIPFNFDLKENLIGFVGTWLPKKGNDLIIADLPPILYKFEKYKLVLIGVGEEKKILASFPQELHSRIIIIPFIKEKKDLLRWYLKMKILLLPSRVESFGLVLAEAMAASCVGVSSEMGFAADLINGKEIIHIKSLENNGIFNTLSSLLHDEKMMKFIAKNGYNRVQQLSWSNTGNTLRNIYDNWLNEKSISIKRNKKII